MPGQGVHTRDIGMCWLPCPARGLCLTEYSAVAILKFFFLFFLSVLFLFFQFLFIQILISGPERET